MAGKRPRLSPAVSKTCNVCQISKSAFAFGRNITSKDGLVSRCRVCVKAEVQTKRDPSSAFRSLLKQKYGMTLEVYESLLEYQDGKCAVCEGAPDTVHGRLYIDHCHETNTVRALLCNGCNASVGLLKESPKRAELLASYMRAHGKE